MAYSLENTIDLTNLANAIRAKTGGNSSMTVAEMATEVSTISGGETIDSRIFQMPTNVQSLFSENRWQYLLQQYADRLVFPSSGVSGSSMFQGSSYLTDELAPISLVLNTQSTSHSMFYNCNDLTDIPTLSGTVYNNINQMFSGCYRLRTIPDAKVANLNFSTNFNNYAGSTGAQSIFQDCRSLRAIPSHLLTHIYTSGTNANSSGYVNQFRNCYCLDEIVGLHVSSTQSKKANMFSSTFYWCCRLKNLTFITNNGTPYSRTWSNQSIDLSTGVGYFFPTTGALLGNSGITTNKEVTDAASYAVLKSDPDWYTLDVAYSRYNHDSAVATINSLPDCSAGSNNVITFLGASGSATDGGAINTLTSAEIAVATNKGWTVTLV